MESTLKNMVLTLLLITLASAGTLGLVYSMTKDTIEASKAAKTTDALSDVLPEFDNDPAADTANLVIDGLPVIVYTARKGNNVVGYAVQTMTRNGFSGEIKMMVGFLPDGKIQHIQVLEQNETPGLGSKMADPGNVLLVSFAGKSPADLKMSVTKDGGDIDAITASTISSRAYVEAVQRAYDAYMAIAHGTEIVDNSVDIVKDILPEYDNDPYSDKFEAEHAGETFTVYPAFQQGKITGYAIETTTYEAYHDEFTLMVGFLVDGTINDIGVVRQEETPGYGGEITRDDNPLRLSFTGKNPSEIKMSLTQAGGDVDGISYATISSDAYVDAVKKAWEVFKQINMEER